MKHNKIQSKTISYMLVENLFKLEKSEKIKQSLKMLDAIVGIVPKGSLSDVNIKDIFIERTFKKLL